MCPNFETYVNKLMKYAGRSLSRHPFFKSVAEGDDSLVEDVIS